jgi:Tol biopolymer transport system component
MHTRRVGLVAASAAFIWVASGGCVDILGDGNPITVPPGEFPEDWADYEPSWSPDGSEIAVSSTWPDGGIFFDLQLLDLQGRRSPVTSGLTGAASPSWSPDGLSLAFSWGLSLYIVNRDGSHLSELWAAHTGGGASYPAWSPDGEVIAYTSGHGTERYINLLDVATSQVTRLTPPGASNEHLSWSPDGTQAVFRRFAPTRGTEYGIYRMEADGSGAVQLLAATVDRAVIRDPAWSPCGVRIAFAAGNSDRLGIHLMDSDGSNISVLTDAGGDDLGPAWSPDCSKIAFSSDRGGTPSDIWIVNADGSGLRRLTVRE